MILCFPHDQAIDAGIQGHPVVFRVLLYQLVSLFLNFVEDNAQRLFPTRSPDLFRDVYPMSEEHVAGFQDLPTIQRHSCERVQPLHHQGYPPFLVLPQIFGHGESCLIDPSPLAHPFVPAPHSSR